MMLTKIREFLALVRPSKRPVSAADSSEKPGPGSRRDFFRKAAVGAVAVTGTAELAKVTASSIADDTAQELYQKDVLDGDKVLAEREYVLMTDQEKDEMVQGFVDNYRGNG